MTSRCISRPHGIHLVVSIGRMEYSASFLQPFTEIIETNAKNGVFPLATSKVKHFLMAIWLRLKLISLYIYKGLRLKT